MKQPHFSLCFLKQVLILTHWFLFFFLSWIPEGHEIQIIIEEFFFDRLIRLLLESGSILEFGLLHELVMILPMDRELASLSEGFNAVSDPTDEWFLARVSVLVLL